MATTSRSADLTSGPMLQKIILFSVPLAASSILQLLFNAADVVVVGRFLRKTSLDELPQLWNILVGDMAVIGPRPALWNQYDLLAERDKYGANDVRPGLTGWAQIHGRDELEIAEKAKLDGWYVEHISFGLDVKCFFGTITAVLKHDGVVEGGTGTLHDEK